MCVSVAVTSINSMVMWSRRCSIIISGNICNRHEARKYSFLAAAAAAAAFVLFSMANTANVCAHVQIAESVVCASVAASINPKNQIYIPPDILDAIQFSYVKFAVYYFIIKPSAGWWKRKSKRASGIRRNVWVVRGIFLSLSRKHAKHH